jgi:uncharacterized membrane protein YsdA (DUF1294 family)
MFEKVFLAWVGIASVWTFLMFGFDKWRAGRSGSRRTSEFSLCLVSALGGWPGGFLGIVLFRHKSAKPAFLLKFASAFIVWAALVVGAWKLARVH